MGNSNKCGNSFEVLNEFFGAGRGGWARPAVQCWIVREHFEPAVPASATSGSKPANALLVPTVPTLELPAFLTRFLTPQLPVD